MLEQIHAVIDEAGASGRFATWKVSANMAIIDAAIQYAIDYGNGKVDKFDKDHMVKIFKEITGDDEIIINQLEENPNFLLFVAGSEIF